MDIVAGHLKGKGQGIAGPENSGSPGTRKRFSAYLRVGIDEITARSGIRIGKCNLDGLSAPYFFGGTDIFPVGGYGEKVLI